MKKAILLFGICAAISLTGCGMSADKLADKVSSSIEAAKNDAEVTQAPEDAKGEDTEEKQLSLGDKGTIDSWKVTVKKAEVKSQIRNGKYYVFKPEKGSKFICVTASVTNKGKEEATFLPRIGLSNKIITAQLYYEDYEYKSSSLMNYDKDLLEKKIKPLTTKKGIITFEVPKKVAKQKNKLILKIGTDSQKITYALK